MTAHAKTPQEVVTSFKNHFYVDVVYSDLETFYASPSSTSSDLLKDYAVARNFEPELFREFMRIVDSFAVTNSSINTLNQYAGTDRNKVYFYLSETDQARFQPIIEYYESLSNFFKVTLDRTGIIRNHPNTFDMYWQQNGYNYPYLYHHTNKINVPEEYKAEYSYAGNGNTSKKDHQPTVAHENNADGLLTNRWRDGNHTTFLPLIPTSENVPYERLISHSPYFHEPMHHTLSADQQYQYAVSNNVIGDGVTNSNHPATVDNRSGNQVGGK